MQHHTPPQRLWRWIELLSAGATDRLIFIHSPRASTLSVLSGEDFWSIGLSGRVTWIELLGFFNEIFDTIDALGRLYWSKEQAVLLYLTEKEAVHLEASGLELLLA